MLDVKVQSSTSVVQIGKIGLKRSGEEAVGLVADLDLVEEVSNEADAAVVNGVVPGATALWRASARALAAGAVETESAGAAAGAQAASDSSGPFGTYTIPIADDGFRVVLGQDACVVEMFRAEVMSYRVKSTPTKCACTVKLRLEGIAKDQVATLVGWLGSPVTVTLERRQGVLPFRKRSAGEVGEIVSGIDSGREYAGVIVGRSTDDDGAEMIEVDDCGDVFVVAATTISGAFPSGDVAVRDQRVAEFVDHCEQSGVAPSWLWLVPELGRAYLSAGTPEWSWTLTEEIVQDAVIAACKAARSTAH
jgi:hypothetical protein